MAAVVPAKEPATNLQNGGRALEQRRGGGDCLFELSQETSALVPGHTHLS